MKKAHKIKTNKQQKKSMTKLIPHTIKNYKYNRKPNIKQIHKYILKYSIFFFI